ncbi:uncharacterized protein LOC126342910 [Schistocerca gregaria]|uniref:uncharacterized protein LOC126342910 n=1 Tax=Schistocerca gregaria TaxID=7010 RepID=UPI00211F1EC7|nr:uncharacterized protein LOC126342910 [Schistocerca gregaria]
MNRRGLLRTAAPYHAVYRIIGLTPFTVDATDCCLRQSPCTVAYAAIVLVLCLAASVNVVHFLTIGQEHISALRFLWLTGTAIAACLMAVVPVATDLFVNTSRYQRILSLLSYRDTEILELKHSSNKRVTFGCKPLYVTSFVPFLCIVVRNVLQKRGLYITASMFLMQVVMLAAVSKYIILVMLVTNDLRCLEETLRAVKRPHPGAAHFRALRRVYRAVCGASHEVLAAHQCFLAVFTGTLLVSTSWHTVCFLLCSGRQLQQVVFVVWHTSLLLSVLVSSHALYGAQASIAATVCRRLQDVRTASPEAKELRHFLLLVRSLRPAHRIFGVVPLDLRLVAAFLSTYTTYTAILMTF